MAALPGCAIRLSAMEPAAGGGTTPRVGVDIHVTASVRGLLIRQSDGSYQQFAPGSLDLQTDSTGAALLTLPPQSACDPTTVTWTIAMPDGVAWNGAVTDAMVTASGSGATPLDVHTLKTSYAWGLVSTPAAPVTAIQGPPGPAPIGTPNKVVATDPSGSATNTAALRALVAADLPAATTASAGIARAPRYNVKDHGLVGDGTTNDTAALLALRATLPAGSELDWPAGTYVLDAGQIAINQTEAWYGSRWGATILQFSTAATTGDLIAVNVGQSSQVNHVHLEGFALYATADRTAGAALHLGYLGKTTLRDLKIGLGGGGFAGRPFYGIQYDRVSDLAHKNVRVEGTVSDAYHLETATGQTIVEVFWDAACTARSAGGWGCNVQPDNTSGSGDIEGLHWEAMSFYQNALGHILLNAGTVGTGSTIRNIHLNGTYLDSATGGPGLSTAGTATIENLVAQGVWASANAGALSDGIYLGSNVREFLVLGGFFLLNGRDGLRLDGCQRGSVIGVLNKSNSQAVSLAGYGMTITGSDASHQAQEIVLVGCNAYNNSAAYPNLQNGLFVGANVLDIDVLNCKIDTGAGTTKLSHNAASSQRVRYANVRDNTGGNTVINVKSGSTGTDVATVDLFGNAAFTGSMSAHGYSHPPTSKAVSYTLTNTDDSVVVTASSLTMTLPSASGQFANRQFTITNDSGVTNTTVNVSGGGAISGSASITLATAWTSRTFLSDGTTWRIIAAFGT